jgi:hypothetical protein
MNSTNLWKHVKETVLDTPLWGISIHPGQPTAKLGRALGQQNFQVSWRHWMNMGRYSERNLKLCVNSGPSRLHDRDVQLSIYNFQWLTQPSTSQKRDVLCVCLSSCHLLQHITTQCFSPTNRCPSWAMYVEDKGDICCWMCCTSDNQPRPLVFPSSKTNNIPVCQILFARF